VLAGDTLSAVGSGLTLPFLLVYLSRIRGMDLAVAGLAVATVAIAGFAGNPVGGWLTDRVGARRALGFGLLVAATGAFMVVLIRGPWDAFAAAAVVGFGAALVFPAQDAFLAIVVDRTARTSVFAVRNLTLNAGYGLGALLASLLVDLSSPRSFEVLYVVDGLTFLAFIPILWVVRLHREATTAVPSKAGRAHELSGYRVVLQDRTFLRFWVLMAFLVTIGFAQSVAAFPAYATGVGGIAASGISLALAANTFTVVAAQFPVLRLMEGRRRTTGIVLACLCWAVAWTITLLVGMTGGRGTPPVLGFSIAMVVFALGETLLAPSQAALANDLAPDHLRGRYNGLYALAWTTGLAVGPAIAGVTLRSGNGTLLFAGLIAGCGLGAMAAARLSRHLPAQINLVTVRAPVAASSDSPIERDG